MENFKLNDRVLVIGKNTKGKIAFIGDTHFAKGKMFGVILDEPKGKYSGSIDSVCYFKCPKNHATFVRACQLQKDTNCSLKNRSAPSYPNYLKNSSFKHGLKTITKSASKSEISNSPLTKEEPVKSPNYDQHEKLKYNKYQEKDLMMDGAGISKENYPGQKDNDCSLEDWIAQTLPNNLKEISSIHGLKIIQELASKSEIRNTQTTKKIPVKSPKNDLPDKLKYNKNQEKDLMMDGAGTSKENYPGQKQNNRSLEDWIAPTFPHNLKVINSKHGFKNIEESASKTEIRNSPITKKKPVKSPKQNKPAKLQYEKLQESEATTYKVGKIGDFEGKMQSHGEALAELNVLKENLTERNKKIEVVYGYLRHLKTYLKWSTEMKKNSNNVDNQIDNFFKLQVDSVLKKMEDIVDPTSNKKPVNFVEDDSAFSEENYFLHLYVDVLEKRNQILADNLTHVRNILERAWNRSCSKRKFECVVNPETSDEQVEKRYKDCSSKRLTFTDVEHETRLFLESNADKNAKSKENSNLKDLEVLSCSEKVKIYLASLLPNKDIPSRTESEINGTMKYENDNNIADQQPILTPDTGIQVQDLLRSLTEPDVSLKYKSYLNNPQGVTRNKVRSTSQSRKQSPKMTPEKTSQNVKDPTKELHEYISEIVSRVFDKNKTMKNCTTEDSSETKSSNNTLQKQKTSMEFKSNTIMGSASHSNILQMKKLPRNSSKLEFEKNVKRPRAASTGRINKRQIFK